MNLIYKIIVVLQLIFLSSCFHREIELNCTTPSIIECELHFEYNSNGFQKTNFAITKKSDIQYVCSLIQKSESSVQSEKLKKIARIELTFSCQNSTYCFLIYITSNYGTLIDWYGENCDTGHLSGRFRNNELGKYFLNYLAANGIILEK